MTTPAVPFNLSVSAHADDVMERLAAKLGMSKAEVLSLGLALLKTSVDAKNQGNRLAIVDPKGKIVGEIGL